MAFTPGQQGDRWTSLPIQCDGGLILSLDVETQGTNSPGSASVLQNYEAANEGGYERILGYNKWDDEEVPGDENEPVLGVGVGLGGVLAARKDSTDYAINYSSGSGWAAVNSSPRTSATSKVRFKFYAISADKSVVITDGANLAAKWDGTTYTEISGTGAPADPKYAEVHNNTLILAGYTAAPNGVSIAAPGTDDDFDGGNGAVELFTKDTIVGVKKFRDEVYFFCENLIQKLVGSSDADYALVDVTTGIGCVSGDSIQEVAGDLMYLAPDGLRSLAATARIGDVELGIVSSNIRSLLLDDTIAYSANDFSSCVIKNKSQYRLFIHDSTIGDNSARGYIGKLKGPDLTRLNFQWSTLKGIPVYCADSAYNGAVEVVVFGHRSNGLVYEMEQGNSFDGMPIEHRYRTPQITFTDSTIRKVLHRAIINSQVKGNMRVMFSTLLDFNNPNIPQPRSIQLNSTGDIALYDTAIYDTDEYGVIQLPVFREKLCGSGFTAAFEYYGYDTNPPHRIDSFKIEFAIKGRR